MKAIHSSAAAVLLALVMAGCGGSGHDIASSGAPAAAPEAATPAADAFTANVSNAVGSSSDTAEPLAVDSSAAGSSDTAEPVPVS